MTHHAPLTADELRKTARAIAQARPAYEKVLEFFTEMFVLQEAAKDGIDLEPIAITEKMLEIKKKENFPLIEPAGFSVDPNASISLFSKICGLVSGTGSEMGESAKTLSEVIAQEKFTPAPLFPAILKEDHRLFQEIASQLEVDEKILAFITYNAVKPSITLCADQLATYLDPDISHTKGICPICGSSPGLSILDDLGKRFFICGFCWHKWPAVRVYCPFCENTDSKTLYYGYNEQESEYRVDICDKCKKYIKTVDTRNLDRMLYPPLEHVSTLHLDMTATKEGKFGPVVFGI